MEMLVSYNISVASSKFRATDWSDVAERTENSSLVLLSAMIVVHGNAMVHLLFSECLEQARYFMCFLILKSETLRART